MNSYYVYAFLDTSKPGKYKYSDLMFEYEPYYIGKGVDKRDKILNRNFEVNERNRLIGASGFNPTVIRIFDKLSENEAYNKENDTINIIGQLVYDSGPLLNKKKKHPNKFDTSTAHKKYQDDMTAVLNDMEAYAKTLAARKK